MYKASIALYVIIAIAVIIFVIKNILAEIKGDHTGSGEKRKYRLGLSGFLALVFFVLFTFLYSVIFW